MKGFSVKCELIETCTFFNSDGVDPRSIKMLKVVYCHGLWKGCARHMVAETVGQEFVPHSLYPNQTHRVPSIIKDAQKSSS